MFDTFVQGHRVNWWTGGHDIGFEGNWIWAKSRQPLGDFVWASGQPNGGIGQNCLDLYVEDFEGHDALCTETLYPICQLNI